MSDLEDRAREMREKPTPHEDKLASMLKLLDHRWKFAQQVVIGGYIVDFYCEDLKLAIEVDGHQHVAQAREDALRTWTLNKAGIRVIRFGNRGVDEDPDIVIAEVAAEGLFRERDVAKGIEEENASFPQLSLLNRYQRCGKESLR